MALLRPRFLRLATWATVLALSIHFLTLLVLPTGSTAAGVIQVCIAAISLGSLIGIVLADYRRGGSLMRRIEEEVLIITIFGLFWLSFATILRVFGRPQNVLVEQTVLEMAPRHAHPHVHHGYVHREIDPPSDDSGSGLSRPPAPGPTIKRTLAPVHYAHAKEGNKREPLKGRKSYVVMEEWVLDRE